MEDITGYASDGYAVITGAVAAVVAWWTSKFGEGKKSKIILGAVSFLILIVVLSVLQSVLGG